MPAMVPRAIALPNDTPPTCSATAASHRTPRWPDGARIALQFVLNHEEGAENCVLDGDPASEVFLLEIIGAAAFPMRHKSMESLFEYGARAGLWRVLRAFAQRRLPLTVFAVARALQRHPEAVAAYRELGAEIAAHGLRWISYQQCDEAAERAHMAEAVDILTGLTGSAPLGWYTGRDSPNTRRLVVEHGGFLYDSDSYADDLPYWTQVEILAAGGRASVAASWSSRMRSTAMTCASRPPRGSTPACSSSTTCVPLRHAVREGDPAGARLAQDAVGRSARRIAGRPARIGALERFLDYVRPTRRYGSAGASTLRATGWRCIPSRTHRHDPDGIERDECAGVRCGPGRALQHSPWVAERRRSAALRHGTGAARCHARCGGQGRSRDACA